MSKRIALSAMALLCSAPAFASPFFNIIWPDGDIIPPPFGLFAENSSCVITPATGDLITVTHKTRITFSDYKNPAKANVSVVVTAVTDPYRLDSFFGDIHCRNGISNIQTTHGLANTGISATPQTVIYVSKIIMGSAGEAVFHIRSITMNGVVKWTKHYPNVDATGWSPDWHLSGVGDLLSIGDGADELQMVRTKTNADNSKAYRYDYFNVWTGALISSKTLTVPLP